MRARWSFDSRRQRLHRVCERLTQPIRLILPDLFQDRLAKLTEHAAHVDMIIGAVAQHDLWVAQRSRRRRLPRVCVGLSCAAARVPHPPRLTFRTAAHESRVLMSFVSELRRRQVFRTAAWYGGLAWLAVEVADTVFPRFGLPDWSVRAVIVGAALGLPLALALAWSFDLSALGIRRETGVVPAPSDRAGFPSARSAVPLWRVPSFWIALAIAVGLTVSAQQAWQRLIRPAFGERPGLAVLPFANLSPDPANAYFADGLHEEILATFARAGGLRVISRTSVQEYRDPKRNLREIADALGVSLILEGSVRREGDDLRLTLQLIDGRTDEHLWAETYDRKFRDALQLQRAVAEQVVAAIGATLTPTEQRLIAASAPSNPEAYEFYLHALTRWNQFASEPELRLLIGLLDRTIELDPGVRARLRPACQSSRVAGLHLRG